MEYENPWITPASITEVTEVLDTNGFLLYFWRKHLFCYVTPNDGSGRFIHFRKNEWKSDGIEYWISPDAAGYPRDSDGDFFYDDLNKDREDYVTFFTNLRKDVVRYRIRKSEAEKMYESNT